MKYAEIEEIMAAAERDARADVGEEFSDDMVVDLASSVLIGQPYSLVQEWCRRNLGFTPASLLPQTTSAQHYGSAFDLYRTAPESITRPPRRRCQFPVLHAEATRLGRPLVCGCAS